MQKSKELNGRNMKLAVFKALQNNKKKRRNKNVPRKRIEIPHLGGMR
jgi:hypothetical protein